MKTLHITIAVIVVFALSGRIQASDPGQNLDMNSTKELVTSQDDENSVNQILRPVPVDGYQAFRDRIEYPESALATGIEPSVMVQAYIGKDGRVGECILLNGPEKVGFEQAIFKAIHETQWSPATCNGQPRAANVQITFQFRLYD